MKKKSFLKRGNPVKITTVATALLVTIALLSSSSMSAALNKILETKNLNLKVAEEKTSIAVEPSTGLAPEIYQKNLISTVEKANNLDNFGNDMSSIRGSTMYAYNVNASGITNGPCYFDVYVPGIITKLSEQTVTNFLSGGTSTADDRWLCCQYGTGVLYQVTTGLGNIIMIGGGGANLNGLAYSGNTNLMYGAGDTSLFLVDMETGAQELIGPFGSDVSYMIGIAFDSNGVLYGWDLGDKLWTIDTSTGDATEVGPLGINLNYAQDGDFDRINDDILYLTAFTISPSYGGFLYACDKTSGACTLISPFQGSAELDASMIPWGWGPDHDVGVKDIISPNDGYANQDMEVIVKVQNYGYYSEENVPVNVVILKDGAYEDYNETEYVDVPVGGNINVEMPTWTPDDWQNTSNESIDYKITAHATVEGDHNPDNDYKEEWFELYFGYFHDVECIGVSGPESGPAQTFPVTAKIKNVGQYNECCFKTYVEIAELDVVSGLPLLEPEYEDFGCIGEIGVGEEKNLTFDDWTPAYLAEETSGTKIYSVRAWTDLNDPQDENPDNDLFTKTIELDFFHDVGIKEVTSPARGQNVGILAYVPIGTQNIEAITENIGTFPEYDMTCYAEIYEYITNCTNGTLVYEDNITNIDIEQPLGGTETLTFEDYNFAAEGVYRLDLNLVDDNDDYPDNNQMTYEIGVDGTAPTSTHTLYPASPDGENGYYVSDIYVTVDSEDPSIGCEAPGSGVKEIKYTINGASGSIPGDHGTFKITDDGNNIKVEYWAVDNVGNAEPKHTFYIDMDQTTPVVPKNISYYAFKENHIWYVTLSVNCTDATSGMDRVEWALNDIVENIVLGPGPIYNWTIEWADILDPYIFKAIAYDKAGNSDFVTIESSDIKSSPSSQSSSQQSSNLLFLRLSERFPNACVPFFDTSLVFKLGWIK